MLIGLFSAGSSPGVSTAVLAMGSAWPSPCVVIDADPSGGDLLAAGGSVVEADREHNLVELMRIGRQGQIPQVLDSQITRLPVGVDVVAGLAHPGQSAGVVWGELAEGLQAVMHRDVLVDLGRWGSPFAPAPLLRACDVLLVVVRTQLRGLRRAERVLPMIKEDLDRHNPGAGDVGLLIVNDHGPYAVPDIARRLSAPVLGELPLDARTAAVFSDGATAPRHMERSALARAVPGVVRTVGQLAQSRQALGRRGPLIRQQAVDPSPSPVRRVTTPPSPSPAAAAVGLREMSRSPRRLSAVPPTGTDS